MAISAANAAKINKMNKAAQNVSLGTIIKNLQTYVGESGSYTAVSADASASRVVVDPTLATITGFNVQVYTSGSSKSSTLKVVNSGSVLYVSTGSAAPNAIATSDVVNWIVW